MFRIDESPHATLLLGFGHNLKGKCRLTGGFRAIDLDDSAARHTADSQSDVESERTGRDYGDVFYQASLAEFHDGAFAKLSFDLAYG